MKNKISRTFTNIICLMAIFLAILPLFSVRVQATDSAFVTINVTGQAGSTVNLLNDKTRQSQKVILDASGNGQFLLSYDDPDTYEYTLSNDKDSKQYTAEVNVMIDDNTGKLIAVITGYDGSKKVDAFSFEQPHKNPPEETNPPTSTEPPSHSTNVGMEEVVSNVVVIISSFLALLLILLLGNRSKASENKR